MKHANFKIFCRRNNAIISGHQPARNAPKLIYSDCGFLKISWGRNPRNPVSEGGALRGGRGKGQDGRTHMGRGEGGEEGGMEGREGWLGAPLWNPKYATGPSMRMSFLTITDSAVTLGWNREKPRRRARQDIALGELSTFDNDWEISLQLHVHSATHHSMKSFFSLNEINVTKLVTASNCIMG